MEFPRTYFEDEVRDGFYVPAAMKRAWAAQIEVMEEFAKVCKKHNIRWFASAGSLLGAVRHGGYIPWDDDIDVHMLRADFIRFCKVAEEELPEGYFLLANTEEEDWENSVVRVVNGKQINFNKEHLEKYHDFPYVAGIDITILDYLSPIPEEENFRIEVVKIVNNVASNITEENQDLPMAQQLIDQVEQICGVTFDRGKSVRLQMYALLDNLFSLYREEEAEKVAIMHFWVDEGTQVYNKEDFSKTLYLPFENTKIAAPMAYDSVIKVSFRDYMNCIQGGGVHNYPHFARQEEAVKDENGKQLFCYEFTSEELERPLVEKKDRKKKEVVFLPYRAKYWHTLEGLWEAAKADPEYDVYVVPMPYYERDAVGNFREVFYEGDQYPDYVDVSFYDDYIFADHMPDVIIMQNPYDEYNCSTSVHPFFYSKNLQQFTEKLVYIPYFVTDEIAPNHEKARLNTKYYVTMPGVIHADKVITQSEQMRQVYIDVLTKFAGEETREIWQEKVINSDCIKQYQKAKTKSLELNLPEEWYSCLKKEDGSWKKVILYHTTVASFVQYQEAMLDKIRRALEIFREQKDNIALIWKPDPITEDVLREAYPALWEKYQLLVEDYFEGDWGIYDMGMDIDTTVEICDAYYGDASRIVQAFKRAGKPVMIEDVEI